MSEVLVVAGERLARYGFGGGHPFGLDRHEAFYREFEARGLDRRCRIEEPRRASTDELALFHTPSYLAFVQQRSATGEGYLDGGDTPAFRGVFEAASDVVGGVLLAGEEIMQGRARRAFVPIAGLHHAARRGAAGFCALNDCGVLVEWLRREHGLQRIAYVDIDAHHGDGLYYGFETDPGLIFADIHEDGRHLYPGTGSEDEIGKGQAAGTKLNLPLMPGADDAMFEPAWQQVLRQFVGSSVPAGVSWARPSRRHVWRGQWMPGKDRSGGRVMVALDTSGSTAGLVSAFLAEVESIAEARPGLELTLVECDASVQRVSEVDGARLARWLRSSRDGGLRGGGDTDFAPIIELARALICLTDGFGPCPPQPPPCPVLWALAGEGSRAPVRWGTVIRLSAQSGLPASYAGRISVDQATG